MALNSLSGKRELTRREQTVVSLLLDGATNKVIASELGISEETVKRHMTNLMDKTGMSTRLEVALRFAQFEHGAKTHQEMARLNAEIARVNAENALLRTLVTRP